jgi:hypothetical protein
MHLINQIVHVLPCSNSAMKGNNVNNRILCYNISAQTIRELLPCLTFGTEPGIPDCMLTWVFSKCKLFLMQGTVWRTTHLTISRERFQLSDVWCPGFMVRGSDTSFTRLSVTFISQRFSNCNLIVDVGVVTLTSDSFFFFFFWNCIFNMNIRICCCSPVLQCDFSKQFFSMYEDLFPSILIFTHCSSLLIFSSHDSCMVT